MRVNFGLKTISWGKLIVGLSLCLIGELALAAGTTGNAPSGSIGWVAQNIQGSFAAISKLISAGSYIAGMGFVIVALFKFKQHKDNPTQVPIGGPIMMLFIGASLIFLPSVMRTAGTTAFSNSASTAGVSGISNISNK